MIQGFIQQFEEALEIEGYGITPDTLLVNVSEFDSMGRLSVILMGDLKYGLVLEAEQLNRCESVQDLYELMSADSKGS